MFTFTQWLNDFLVKAAGHKYIKRIPYQSGGKLRYRYIYNVTHTHAGKHVLDPDHMQVGTKLMLDATSGKEVHGHITAVSGDKVTFEYDDGPRKGESVTMSKAELATELDKVHGISDKLSTARAKQKAVLDKLKERGASEKQIAREQKRLDALGGEAEQIEEDEEDEEDEESPLLSISEQKVEVGGRQYSMWDVLTGKVKTRTPKGNPKSGNYGSAIDREIGKPLREQAQKFDVHGPLGITRERELGGPYRTILPDDFIQRLIREGYITKDSKIDDGFLRRVLDTYAQSEKEHNRKEGERLTQRLVDLSKDKIRDAYKKAIESEEKRREAQRGASEADTAYRNAYKSLENTPQGEELFRSVFSELGLSEEIPASWRSSNFTEKATAFAEKKGASAKKKLEKQKWPRYGGQERIETVEIVNIDGKKERIEDAIVLRGGGRYVREGGRTKRKTHPVYIIGHPSGVGFKVVADDPSSEYHGRVLLDNPTGAWGAIGDSDLPATLPKSEKDKKGREAIREELRTLLVETDAWAGDDVVKLHAWANASYMLSEARKAEATSVASKELGVDPHEVAREYKKLTSEAYRALEAWSDEARHYNGESARIERTRGVRAPSINELIADLKPKD
jgi:hypothetical protein